MNLHFLEEEYPISEHLDHEETAVLIAIDTDVTPVKMICATEGDKNDSSPYILEHRSFRTLGGFQRYWNRSIKGGRSHRVCLPRYAEDTLGLQVWLEKQGVTIEIYSHLSSRGFVKEFSIWGLPVSFQEAYGLAFYASHRVYAGQISSEIWESMMDLQISLRELRRKIHILTCALPRSPSLPELLNIPF